MLIERILSIIMEKMHDDFSHLNTGPFRVPNMVTQLDFSTHPG